MGCSPALWKHEILGLVVYPTLTRYCLKISEQEPISLLISDAQFCCLTLLATPLTRLLKHDNMIKAVAFHPIQCVYLRLLYSVE